VKRKILYIQFGDPAAYPPIEHSSHILADHGWQVLLLGTDAFQIQAMRFTPHSRIRLKNLSLALAGGKLRVQYFLFFLWCVCWACIWRPSWVYASDPLSTPVALIIRAILRVKTVYHEHDAPGAEASLFMRLVLSCRKSLAASTELCIIPQAQRLEKFIEETGRRSEVACVWNCPRRSELPSREMSSSDDFGDDILILYYHGSINEQRLPQEVVLAVSKFGGAIRLRIAGYEVPGSIGYLDHLKRIAAEHGAPSVIDYVGVISPHKRLLQSAQEAHVGLSLVPRRPNDINLEFMVGASNKAFDCMGAGLPLLVANNPEWVSTFVGPGFGRACDPNSVSSIEEQLRWYLENPKARRQMARQCIEMVDRHWNYDTAFGEVVKTLEAEVR
jgi:glycosyltransferase involved in cell wall biosynthesis